MSNIGDPWVKDNEGAEIIDPDGLPAKLAAVGGGTRQPQGNATQCEMRTPSVAETPNWRIHCPPLPARRDDCRPTKDDLILVLGKDLAPPQVSLARRPSRLPMHVTRG
jgi:hypothetical protein